MTFNVLEDSDIILKNNRYFNKDIDIKDLDTEG
jgi:hypothetical protein